MILCLVAVHKNILFSTCVMIQAHYYLQCRSERRPWVPASLLLLGLLQLYQFVFRMFNTLIPDTGYLQ